MSDGVLGKAMTVAGQNTTVYTVPSDARFSTASICLVNLDTTEATVRVSIGTSATPGDTDFIEYDAKLPPNGGILERSCVVCSPNENVIVKSNNSRVACRVYGLEQL